MRIYAEFEELEPFSNLNVYYKGFKIGRAIKVVPNKDFSRSKVTIVLNSWSYNLPNNIKAKIQKAQKDSDVDYLEIIYPSSPSLTKIKYGDKIEGEVSHNLSDFIKDVAEGGGFDDLKGNTNNLLESANDATKNISALLQEVTSILKDIHPQITTAANNLSETTVNLNKMSVKLEKSIQSETISNSMTNVENTTKNLEGTTLFINTKTLPAVNATICSLKTLIDNINTIVKGIGNTLQKRMGGARLIFGTPVSKN